MQTPNTPLPTTKFLLMLLISCLIIRFVSLSLYPLMDTTEARYGEMARIMFETGNWVTPMFDYKVPFWGKPPIFTWLSSLGFSLFGISEFAARVPHLIVGLGVIWLVYRLAKDHFQSSAMGLFSASILASTISFIILSGAVMTDTALTFSITLSMISFWQAWNNKGDIWGYLFFIGLALGMLSKGPLAIVLIGISLTIWLLPNSRWRKLWRILPWGYGTLLFLVISVPWYALAEYKTPGFLDYFIVGEHIKRFIVSGWQGDLYGTAHERTRGTIWVYALTSMLPWSPLLLWQWIRAIKNDKDVEESPDGFGSFLLFWMLSPMILFSFSGNILASYVMPALPAMALLLAYLHSQRPLPNWLYKTGLITPFLLIVLVSVLHYDLIPKRSEDKILAIWKQQPEATQSDLFYLHKRPFSGQYYSAGKAKQRSTDVKSWLPSQHKAFFIVQSKSDHTVYPNWACDNRNSTGKENLMYCESKL
ncbi:glycosyltransferase family 39 protein [Marinomonas rhizomae]|uniref:Dolichyl-phosphate-mannose-protein mannosyltransferase n=1 Tax=Marinomonas rhizomae TaxID=491948 RepID=A0A366JD44_9GAMM|nr:glycosyltransferase family 39 protein [Marinomonas rhizomae]RBP84330.1 dolichyl-phosphate-mannose-protein mannosyltransferase [Marinomonas rhizomae]RNF74646.1 glycosyltransferase family 39 protein [Marinomonas rhizomae]